MSDHSAYVCEIDIEPCPNSDNLFIAKPRTTGWQCLVRKDEGWKTGDLGAYIPIETKVKPSPKFNFLEVRNWRVRTIKLRGQISQGLVVRAKPGWKLGQDVTKELGVSRYERPEEGQWKTVSRKNPLSQFKKRIKCFLGLILEEQDWFKDHTDIENIKNHPYIFSEGEEVVITEKSEGTNHRTAYDGIRTPRSSPIQHPSTIRWYHKIARKFFRPTFFVGSHFMMKDPNSTLIYTQVAKALSMEAKYQKEFKGHRVVVFDEIFGQGVPNGCKKMWYGTKEPRIILFDIKLDGKWLDWNELEVHAKNMGLPTASVLYKGPFSLEKVKELTLGKTTIWFGDKGQEHIREGVVIRAAKETQCLNLPGQRKWLKSINPEYLLLKGKQEEQEEKDAKGTDQEAAQGMEGCKQEYQEGTSRSQQREDCQDVLGCNQESRAQE